MSREWKVIERGVISRWISRRHRLVLLVGAQLWTSGASAETTRSFSLQYEAPPQCPAREQLIAAIVARDPRLRETGAAPAARRYRLVLREVAPDEPSSAATTSRSSSNYVGRIQQDDAAFREVSGADCANVANALALVLALALRASESQVDEQADVAGGALRSMPVRGTPAAASKPAATIGDRAASRDTIVLESDRESQGSALAWALGAGAMGCWGCAPELLAGPSVSLERSHEAGWLFVGAQGEFALGIDGQRDRLWQVAPQIGLRKSLVRLDLALAAKLALGELNLRGGAGRNDGWVVPALGASLRARPSRNWWLEFGAELGVPLFRREVVTGERAGFATQRLVLGFGASFGFGKVSAAGITGIGRGHSLM